jgi:hypothetical protein
MSHGRVRVGVVRGGGGGSISSGREVWKKASDLLRDGDDRDGLREMVLAHPELLEDRSALRDAGDRPMCSFDKGQNVLHIVRARRLRLLLILMWCTLANVYMRAPRASLVPWLF